MTTDVSLQINLSAGDLRYMEALIPQLIEEHRKDVDEVFVVFEELRPPKTRMFDPDIRLPQPGHRERTEQALRITEQFKADGLIDRIEVNRLDTDGERIMKEMVGWPVSESHEIGGTAIMSYARGIDAARTRYVVHFDGDMLVHQDSGFRWIPEALKQLKQQPEAIAAIPRPAPPMRDQLDQPSRREGRPVTDHTSCWSNDWFSTRAFLMDKERLEKHLPLIQGVYTFETLIWKFLRRRYPRGFEIYMHQGPGKRGARCLMLKDERAWMLHPVEKGDDWLQMLPHILSEVKTGNVPDDQRGNTDIDNDAWKAFLAAKTD